MLPLEEARRATRSVLVDGTFCEVKAKVVASWKPRKRRIVIAIISVILLDHAHRHAYDQNQHDQYRKGQKDKTQP
jgi:hypothetical protein